MSFESHFVLVHTYEISRWFSQQTVLLSRVAQCGTVRGFLPSVNVCLLWLESLLNVSHRQKKAVITEWKGNGVSVDQRRLISG